MIIEGIKFDVKILPDLESVTDAAQQICLSDKLAIQKENLSKCLDSVVSYIRGELTAKVSKTNAVQNTANS